jgi:hypothetical protein
MNYYIDTEFIEDFHYTRNYGNSFWKRRIPKALHYVDLISIGIVAEDGREYYAVSKDFDLKHVWNKYDLLNPLEMGDEPEKVYWLRENVLRPLHKDLCKNISGDMKNADYFYNLSTFSYKSLKSLISMYGKTNKQIAVDIQCFTAGLLASPGVDSSKYALDAVHDINRKNPPTFYGYYADYDWVLFCSLCGRMLDIPKGYPMYCRDLKQLMDHLSLPKGWKDDNVPGDNEHHALADARWNKKLHRMLMAYLAGLPHKIHS